jgi:hypothetical protein
VANSHSEPVNSGAYSVRKVASASISAVLRVHK